MNLINYITTNNDNYVRVYNGGGYVAEFYLSYYLQGRYITKYSGLFYIGQTRQISIPSGASNPHLRVIARIFGNFITVYNSNISYATPSCFNMSGSILNPYITKVPCSDLGTTPPNHCCCCCCKNPINGGVYIDILNQTPLPIFFILQYKVDVRTFTKESPVFEQGKSERLQMSHSAVNICFNVIDNSTNPPSFICNVSDVIRKKHCYKLVPTQSNPEIVEVKC